MGDHHDGLVEGLAGGFQQGDDVLAGLGVQVAGGLIGQQDGGFGSQGSGDGHPLLLAAGEVPRQAVQLALQAQEADDLHDEGPVGLLPVQGEGEDDVLPHRENGDEVVVLEDEADLLPAEDGGLLPGKLGQVGAAHLDAPLGGGVQPTQHVQEGGLAAAGGADDGGELAPLDGQVHPVQGADHGLPLAVVLFQALGLQDDVVCHGWIPPFLIRRSEAAQRCCPGGTVVGPTRGPGLPPPEAPRRRPGQAAG